MNNYIRACFCVNQFLNPTDLLRIKEALPTQSCVFSIGPQFNMNRWIEQRFLWKPMNKSWGARLSQISFAEASSAMVSLDIDENIFLDGGKLSYYPTGEPLYVAYKSLLRELIEQIRPFIGVIDWDADLLCSNLKKNSYATWGNFLSFPFLENWSIEEKATIQESVDEMIVIDNIGILTFNHPLGYSEANESQRKFWLLIANHVNAIE